MAAELDEIDGEAPGRADVDGATAAAILLMLLAEDDAGAIVKAMDPGEVRRLSETMFKVASADEATIEAALDLFVDRCRRTSALSVGAEPRIRSVLTQALGNVRADNILGEIAPRSSAAALDLLRWMEVETIASLLAKEHPQAAALILAVLTPEVAAAALARLEPARRSDLLARAARLTRVTAQAVEDLEAILREAGSDRAAAAPMKLGGAPDAAKIVNRMRKTDGQQVIAAIRETDEALAAAIEREMFEFGDLSALDTKSLGAVLRSVEAATLTLALKGAEPELLEQMLGCMSSRAAQTIRDEMAESPPAKRAEVDAAQRQILDAARKLADSGEIQLGGGDDDYV